MVEGISHRGKSMNRWLRDLLIIPLIVGLIVAVVTFVLPKIFEPRKELSYTIDAPIKHIDPDKKPTIGSLKIEINGMSTSSLFCLSVFEGLGEYG